MKILLGSNSPRRNELLTQMGIVFDKVSINCNEDFDAAMPGEDVPVYLSQKKSYAYEHLRDDEILITADTVVVQDLTILNKPTDATEAEQMLRSISNGSHHVITGVTLRSLTKEISFSNVTTVRVDTIYAPDIQRYISEYKPYDKAGGYGIQEWFGLTQVIGIQGCYYNVVGLPCSSLFKHLRHDYGVL